LSWEVSDISEISKYRVYVADSSEENFILRDSTTELEITIDNLTVNRKYAFRVASVSLTGLEGLASETVTARISYISIGIANDAEYTNTRNVQIQITAPAGTSHLMLSEDSAFTDDHFVSYSSSKSFELSDEDGVKTVYARLQFSDGSESGDLLEDDIILDTRANIESVEFSPSGINFTTEDTVFFEVNTAEIDGEAWVSFTGVNQVELYDNATHSDLVIDDGVYSGYYVVPNSFYLNNGQVTGNFTDAAGNNATSVTAYDVLNIFTPPLPVKLTAVPVSTYKIELSWTSAVSDHFSSYRVFRDNSSAVDDSSELLTSITNRSSLTYVDTTLDASTEYFYRVYVYDNSGLMSGSNVDSATTFVNTAPDPVEFFVSNQTDSTAEFNWTISDEEDFEAYRIYRKTDADVDTTDQFVILINNRNTLTYKYDPPGIGTYFFRIFVFDKHGEATASVNSIYVQFTK